MVFQCKLWLLLVIFSEACIGFAYFYVQHYDDANKIADDYNSDQNQKVSDEGGFKVLKQKKICWMRLDSKEHINAMDKLEARYANVRKEYQEAAEKDNFDGEMLKMMLISRGAAEREIHKVRGYTGLIPAGINMGGYFMMRMPNSLLFFHRMKLRNNTHFRVSYLRNDLQNLTLYGRLALGDLHLLGSYDRSTTDKDPSILYYTPTYGLVEFLLKNVQYTFEGRYRLLKDKLNIVLIMSNIDFDDALMLYLNNTNNEATRIRRGNIEEFLIRLKADLDEWLRDYFNDYLMYFGVVGKNNNNEFQQYDKDRAAELNNYIDKAISSVTKRLLQVGSDSITLPKFTIFTVNKMEIILKNGVLRGLETMYRRSVATGKKTGNIHIADAVVGFSSLKVTYEYEASLAKNSPALTGLIILSADELTALMEVTASRDSETVDVQFGFLEQTKPESLIIEGAANRVISNFKYLLEQHIIAIMSSTILHNIKMLSSLTKCVVRDSLSKLNRAEMAILKEFETVYLRNPPVEQQLTFTGFFITFSEAYKYPFLYGYGETNNTRVEEKESPKNVPNEDELRSTDNTSKNTKTGQTLDKKPKLPRVVGIKGSNDEEETIIDTASAPEQSVAEDQEAKHKEEEEEGIESAMGDPGEATEINTDEDSATPLVTDTNKK